MSEKHPYGDFRFYVPRERRYPDYRIWTGYGGFHPDDYCRTLQRKVRSGEMDWARANALWRNYVRSLQMVYPNQLRPAPCAFPDTAPSLWTIGRGSPGGVKVAFPIWG